MKLNHKTTQPQIETVTTYGDLLINYLQQLNVEFLFGVPGGAIEPLFDALSRHTKLQPYIQPKNSSSSIIPLRKHRQRLQRQGIQPVIARHEAGAAFMADGYARETGKLGVCCATTGPGTTNLITGVAAAYEECVPMLVITAQTALANFGKKGLQDSSTDAIDTVNMFKNCTRYNSLVSHADQLEDKLYQALTMAYQQPRGPVHLSIPTDVMNTPIETPSTNYDVTRLSRSPYMVDEYAYNELFDAVSKAKRTVLFVGGGCANASTDISRLAETIDAEIVSTPSGKKWVDAHNHRYKGVFGFAGHQSAMNTVMGNDVERIIAVGTTLGELATAGWDDAVLNKKLIHIAQSAEDFAHSPMAGIHVLGNIRCIFKRLTEDMQPLKGYEKEPTLDISTTSPFSITKAVAYDLPKHIEYENVEACSSNDTPIKPQRLMCELAKRFPRGTRYIGDTGNTWAWMTHYLMNSGINTQRTNFGFGAMGWAIGATIGTALGNRDQAAVCITGDGSYLMSAQEITVAVEQRLPVVYIILNDQALGMIKHGQRLGGAEEIGFHLPSVDFAMMARSVGANGHTIKSISDLENLNIHAMLSDDKPTLLDIHINPEEVPPIGSRVKTLSEGR